MDRVCQQALVQVLAPIFEPTFREVLMVPERTAVFTVRLAPSLIAALRAHARSRGVTVSAAVAEAVRLYLGQVRERHGGKAR